MTTTPNDGVPVGRKLRVVGTCPTACAMPPEDHVQFGDEVHHGQEQTDPTDSLVMSWGTSDDGSSFRIDIGLCSGAQPDWSWTADQAQQFIEQLQSLLASAPGLTVAPNPLPTARETVALALLLQAEPHPATPAGSALQVLAGSHEPEHFASVDILGEIQTLQALIQQGKHRLDEVSDPDGHVTAETQLVFRSLVHLEEQRRALMLKVLETPA